MGRLDPLVAELKRRRVFRALLGWGVVSFAVLQVIEPVLHAYHLPEWTLTIVVTALGAGFPVAAVLAWVFDLSARGIVRTAPADPAPEGTPAPGGPRLALLLVGLGLLAATPGAVYYFVWPGTARPGVEGRPPAAPPSVAVLPFADMSPGRDQEYFADGISEEILNALAHVDGLRVIGRTSSFSFKGRNATVAEIGRALRVGAVLEGSVRREGARVRITAQLVRTDDESHVWSETFDREAAGVFAVQDGIARAVTDALRVRLLPGASAPGGGARSTSAEAFGHFLMGREFRRRGTARQVYERAREELEEALRLDPGYAPAWAELAHVLFSLADDEGSAPAVAEAKRRARAAAEKAVELDPRLPDAYVERARIRETEDWDFPGARADAERALALAPGYSRAQRRFGWTLAQGGRPLEGVPHVARAVELDPLDSANFINLGAMYLSLGRVAEAREALERARALAPESSYSPFLYGVTLLASGQPAAALASFQAIRDPTWRLAGTAMARHDLGDAAGSAAALEELVAGEAYSSAYQIAQVHAWRGDRDQAFAWLDRAFEQRDAGLAELKIDATLRRIRDDPRFAALVRRVNLPPE